LLESPSVGNDQSLVYDNTNFINHIPFMDKDQPQELN